MRLSVLAIILMIIFGCKEKPFEAIRSSRDEKVVQEMWKTATPVAPKDVIGTWVSEKGDLPAGFNVKSYYITFGNNGGGSFSQISKDGATGLPFEYEIEKSKLYASTSGPPLEEWEELRKYKMLILSKNKIGITVYRKAE